MLFKWLVEWIPFSDSKKIATLCDNSDTLLEIELNHFVLAFLTHPCATTPTCAITSILTVEHAGAQVVRRDILTLANTPKHGRGQG